MNNRSLYLLWQQQSNPGHFQETLYFWAVAVTLSHCKLYRLACGDDRVWFIATSRLRRNWN